MKFLTIQFAFILFIHQVLSNDDNIVTIEKKTLKLCTDFLSAGRNSDENCNCKWENSSPWSLLTLKIECQNRNYQNENFEAELLPELTTFLDVSWNDFEFVPDFVGIDLLELSISHNRITLLDNNNFKKIKNLKVINLSANKIEALSIQAFDGLASLEKLDLSRNKLDKITSNVFSPLTNLNHLILSRNPLLNETFSENEIDLYLSLGVTPKLQILEVEETNIDRIDIVHGVGLKEIFLSYNRFDKPPDLPRSIEIIDFSENLFDQIEPKFFPHLKDLKVLLMQDMQTLTTVEKYSLFGLPNLRVLSLQGSWRLSRLHANTFGGNNDTENKLEILNLRGTNILSLNASLLNDFENVHTLDLKGIPMICNCNNKWIKELPIETYAECMLPIELRGRRLKDIDVEDIKCRRWSGWVYRIINGLMILMLLVLCGVGIWLLVMGLRPSQKRQSLGPSSPYARVTIEPNRAE